LSLCQRAGKLVMGTDAVKETVEKGRACLLLVSKDASENTKNRFALLAKSRSLPLVPLEESLDQLWYILGKRAGVFCVTDRGLSDKITAGAGQPQQGVSSCL